MGRQRNSRQSRRAQERRQQVQQKRAPARKGPNWSLIAGAVVVLAAIALFVLGASGKNPLGGVGAAHPTATESPGKTIAGVGCNPMEGVVYHVHAALRVYNKGKLIPQSNDSGHNYNNDCLYWLHVHDQSGVIHVEAPKVIHPTLGTWIDVQRTTNSAGDVSPIAMNKAGLQRHVWLNGKRYSGDPRSIVLKQHTDIVIEYGPPFSQPKPFDFKANGV